MGINDQPILADYSEQGRTQLCQNLRIQIVKAVSENGGHLASNLGAVELTVAIHSVFDTRSDRLVFDVGHQCYPHKIITGRGEEMETLRKKGGLSGFPKPSESEHDAFIAGHASNSVAVATGMAHSRDLLRKSHNVIALMGDGALTGGLAFEGLATGGALGSQLLVIVNDNGMSITRNVGGISRYLASQRLKPQYLTFRQKYRKFMFATSFGKGVHGIIHRIKQGIKSVLLPCSLFEQMGYTYLGPVDGHDLNGLIRILSYAKEQTNPVVLHVRTKKGRGYPLAEESPDRFHGTPPFEIKTGEPLKRSGETFTSTFGKKLTYLGRRNEKIMAITAAMQSGTGLDRFADVFPLRTIDVGIAEGCAVSIAAGLAKQGAIPVFAVYSTFLQRGFDMLIHDIAIEKLHAIFAVDRAGLVGEDGETHHGVFDISYLGAVPSLTLLAPSCHTELESMLDWAINHQSGTVAIRYPRGSEGEFRQDYTHNPADTLRTGEAITLVGYGTQINPLLECADRLEQDGFTAQVIKLNQLAPLDGTAVLGSVQQTGALLVAEDCISHGCMGEKLASMVAQRGLQAKICLVNLGDTPPPHGTVSELMQDYSLDAEGLYQRSLEVLSHGKTTT
ncbi:MAG: 1-deoxy-D-xylulose-5-phosphate synthase [Eubacteriales bacterium]